VVAADGSSGVGSPDFQKLAAAYSLGYDRIKNNDEVDAGIARVLAQNGAVICEVNIAPNQELNPKVSSFRKPDGTLASYPLEDMSPFLPREELWENMHMFDDEE
jgi:acetolactate synthase I/II/III large subunit